MLRYKNLLPTGKAGKKFFKNEVEEEEHIEKKTAQSTAKGKRKVLPTSTKTLTVDHELTIVSKMKTVAEYKDSMTRNILQESVFLPKKAPGMADRENALVNKSSLPTAHSAIKNVPSFTLGMAGLNFSPMKLRRVYGRTDTIPVLNLTGIHRSHIVYAASNVVIFFDYFENRQSMLQGHKNKITCLAKDNEFRYFASGDVGKDSSIIIWDLNTGFPHKTFPASHSGLGVISIGFIGVEEYVGTIGLEQRREITEDGEVLTEDLQTFCIWNFAHHEDPHHPGMHHEKAGGKPEAYIVIPKHAGFQRDLVFDEEYPDYSVSTGDSNVVFYTWLRDERKISCHIPKIPKRFIHRMKKFTQSIWMKSHNWCLTGTGAGYIVAWATTVPLGLQEPPNPNLNIKEYKRSFKVGDCAITALTAYKQYFVIGEESGLVKFYDHRFRVVRWTKSYKLPPINCIQFNFGESMPDFKEEMQSHYDESMKPHAHREKVSAVRDYTFGGQKYRQPSETTIERAPFNAPDFVIGCEGGSVYYYHLAEARVDALIYGTPGQIVALDTCPNTTHLTMATRDGDVHMYDYVSHTLIFSGKIFKKAVEVTCLKFHPSGSFAFFGMTSGQIYFRRSYTWKAMDTPLDHCTSSIERIIFSDDGIFMAHWDSSHAVTLYNFHVRRETWNLRGKHRSHYKQIVDLSFLLDPNTKTYRLFSLGQDRALIEYDIPKSSSTHGLIILNIFHADNTSIPTSLVFDSPWPGMGPLIMYANSDNKIKIYDQNMRQLRRCCQGPNYGTPVNRMISIQPDLKNGRGTKFILMILGNKIGIMKTPVDGNPFKSMAVLGHPDGIREAVVGCNMSEIFTCGNRDNSCFMWEPNIQALETCSLSGGSGVAPYMQMLDAGLPPGRSLVEDVENVFYHLMLRSASSPEHMFNMPVEIAIAEIPTVVRTCGFFPTEAELDIMLEEAEFLGALKTGEKPVSIGYEDFIKLFANHRLVPPLSPEDIYAAFDVLGELNEDDDVFIDRDSFTKYLTEKGENFTMGDLPHYLPGFYRQKEKVDIFAEGAEQPAWLQMAAVNPDIEVTTAADDVGLDNQYPSLDSLARPSVAISLPPDPNDTTDEDGQPVVESDLGIIPQPPDQQPSFQSFMYDGLLPGEDGFLGEDRRFSGYGSSIFEEYELPEEITAKFFIDKLLPDEALQTIGWDIGKRDEEQQLADIYAEKDWRAYDEILKRWKGRDEWRYFKRVFERFNDAEYPMARKLRLAIEMDYYCRTGTWPNIRRETLEEEGEEDEGEDEGESYESIPTLEIEDKNLTPEGAAAIAAAKDVLAVVKASETMEGKEANEQATTKKKKLTLVAPEPMPEGLQEVPLVQETKPRKSMRKSILRKKRSYEDDEEEGGESDDDWETDSDEDEDEDGMIQAAQSDWLDFSTPVVAKEPESEPVTEETSAVALTGSEGNEEETDEGYTPPFTEVADDVTPSTSKRRQSARRMSKRRHTFKIVTDEDEDEEETQENLDGWWDAARHSHDEVDNRRKFFSNRTRAMSKKDFDEMVKNKRSREASIYQK